MQTGIHIEGGKLDVESAVAIAGAITEVLTAAGRERTPEAVQLRAMDVIGEAVRAAGVSNVSFVNSHIGDDEHNTAKTERGD